jgi:hypothetical protein
MKMMRSIMAQTISVATNDRSGHMPVRGGHIPPDDALDATF